MALSLLDLLDMLRREFPDGTQDDRWETIAMQAINDGIVYGAARLRERVDVDIWGNGVQTRFALTGRQVRLLDVNDWTTPVTLNTSGIDAPTLIPNYTVAFGTGSLNPGIYGLCYAWVTTQGISPPSPITVFTCASDQGTITRPALTPLPFPVTGVIDYISVIAGSGEMHAVSNAAQSGVLRTIADLPSSANLVPQLDYTDLTTLTPEPILQGGVAPDGSANPLVTTLILDTAPDAYTRTLISYTRRPLMPTLDSTPIGLDDDYLRLTCRAHMAEACAMNTVSGDATDWANIGKNYKAQLDNMLLYSAGRRPARTNFVAWQ